jgi:hypothetical protein
MGAHKHLNRSIIPKNQPQERQHKYLNADTAFMQGWDGNGDESNVLISIRFLQHRYQCFSDWDKIDMGIFWNFIDKVHQYTWTQMKAQSGKGQNKTGFAMTVIPMSNYPESDFKASLDPELPIFELRVDQGKRVHCFRDKSICYICWLDKNHEICP